MWQTLITGIIIATALGVAVYRIIRFFRSPRKKNSGCTVACKGCALGAGIHRSGVAGSSS
jgi:hypothetical protein